MNQRFGIKLHLRRQKLYSTAKDTRAPKHPLHPHPPRESLENGYIESLYYKMGDKYLNLNYFWSLAQAKVVMGDWRKEHKHLRPHCALGYQTWLSQRAALITEAGRLQQEITKSSKVIFRVTITRQCRTLATMRSINEDR